MEWKREIPESKILKRKKKKEKVFEKDFAWAW